MIEHERHGEILVLRLAHGKVSALDVELLREIPKSLEAARADDVGAVVLTGTGGAFCAGVDLVRLEAGGDAYLEEFMPALGTAFRELFFFPKPVVAAVNGHAIAGGCILAQCCDLRIGAAGSGRIGVPELSVGVPFPLLALEIMRFVTPAQHVQEVLYEGSNYRAEDALQRGLFDRLAGADELLDEAIRSARKLGAFPRDAFGFNKELLRRPVAETIAEHGKDDDARARELWGSPDIRAALSRFVEATLRR